MGYPNECNAYSLGGGPARLFIAADRRQAAAARAVGLATELVEG